MTASSVSGTLCITKCGVFFLTFSSLVFIRDIILMKSFFKANPGTFMSLHVTFYILNLNASCGFLKVIKIFES